MPAVFQVLNVALLVLIGAKSLYFSFILFLHTLVCIFYFPLLRMYLSFNFLNCLFFN